MNLKKITYFISTTGGPVSVEGYAVESRVPVRFCVRGNFFDGWVTDHYDSGRRIGERCWSRRAAIAMGEKKLRRKLASGQYKRTIAAIARKNKW